MRFFFSFSLQVFESPLLLILQDCVRDVEQRGREERPGLGQGEGRRSRRVRPDLQLSGQCATRTTVSPLDIQAFVLEEVLAHSSLWTWT